MTHFLRFLKHPKIEPVWAVPMVSIILVPWLVWQVLAAPYRVVRAARRAWLETAQEPGSHRS